jgi:hypothetical protein
MGLILREMEPRGKFGWFDLSAGYLQYHEGAMDTL